jgi:predicted unusual protein kinase regulating ubiquinone biosynthesis (AarF/ABC1/UbiB family)
MLKLLPKNFKTAHIFTEIREMLTQEMDYAQEIKQTEAYGLRLKGDSRFVVPRIHPEFCGPKVIASSFERGLSADDPLIQALSQERRNRLALHFIDLYFKELFEWGVVQTDPHLGNYRVRLGADGNDQLVLFDFGAVRTYPQEFLNPYRRMVKAALLQDRMALKKASLELKFIHADDPPALLEMFEKFCLEMVEPFADIDYDWKNSTLPKRLTRQVFAIIQKFELRPAPREILFLDRKTGGVFIFCAVLRARINSRSLLLKYLKDLE